MNSNTLKTIGNVLHDHNINIDISSLMKNIKYRNVTNATLPTIIQNTMSAIRLYNLKGHEKKTIVICIINEMIKSTVEDKSVQTTLITLVPHFIDTMYNLSKDNNIFANSRSCCF